MVMILRKKVVYLSPNKNGFNFGISYAPKTTTGDMQYRYKGITETTVRYKTNINDWGVKTAYGFTTAIRTNYDAEKLRTYSRIFGIQAGKDNLKLGMFSVNTTDLFGLRDINQNTFGIGTTYNQNNFTYGISRSESKLLLDNTQTILPQHNNKVSRTEISVNYNMLRYFDIYAGLIKINRSAYSHPDILKKNGNHIYLGISYSSFAKK